MAFVAVAILGGLSVLRLLRIPAAEIGAAHIPVAFALGLSIHSFFTLILGTLGFPGWAIMPMFVLLALGLINLQGITGAGLHPIPLESVYLLIPTSLLLSLAMTNDPFVDEYAYHLTAPVAYVNEGKLFHTVHDALPNLYFLNQMNTIGLLAMGGDPYEAPRFLEVLRCLGASLILQSILIGMTNRPFAFIGALLFLLNEEVFLWGPSAHVDSGQSLYALAGLYLLCQIIGKESTPWRLFLLAGWLLGCVVAVKQVGIFFIGAIVVCFLAGYFRRFSKANGAALTVGILAAVLPWSTRSFVYTGNPMLPFFRELFPVWESAALSLRAFYDFYPVDARPIYEKIIPSSGHLRVIVDNTRFSNTYGSLPFILLATLLLIFSKSRGAVVGSAAYRMLFSTSFLLLVPLIHAPYQRFLVVLFPVSLIVFLVALYQWRQESGLRTKVAAILLALFIGLAAQRGVERILRERSPKVQSGHEIVTVINKALTENDRLLMSARIPETPFLTARFSPNVPVVTYAVIPQMLASGMSGAAIHQHLAENGITHVAIDTPGDNVALTDWLARETTLIFRQEKGGYQLHRLREPAFSVDLPALNGAQPTKHSSR